LNDATGRRLSFHLPVGLFRFFTLTFGHIAGSGTDRSGNPAARYAEEHRADGGADRTGAGAGAISVAPPRGGAGGPGNTTELAAVRARVLPAIEQGQSEPGSFTASIFPSGVGTRAVGRGSTAANWAVRNKIVRTNTAFAKRVTIMGDAIIAANLPSAHYGPPAAITTFAGRLTRCRDRIATRGGRFWKSADATTTSA
jgi:hypothetical protein